MSRPSDSGEAESFTPYARVFPGLRHRLPEDGKPWRADDSGRFTVTGRTVTGARGGIGRLRHGGDRYRVDVLGPLHRLAVAPATMRVDRPGQPHRFRVFGTDPSGYAAPIDPADVTVSADPGLGPVTTEADGFVLRPVRDGAVTVTVGPHRARLTVAGARREHPVTGELTGWRVETARAVAALTPDGAWLRLRYDFTASTATRAGYVVPAEPLPVPDGCEALTWWIDGDGNGAWPSLRLRDGDGTDWTLRGPHLTWRGRRRIRFRLPARLVPPVTLECGYLAETDPARRYTGDAGFGPIVAQARPGPALQPAPAPVDPVLTGDVAAAPWRFGLISDTQFVARDPHGPLVAAARRTLREMTASGVALVLVAGDFVDEGSPADLDLAHRILTEELTGVDWCYLPGNHEVMGGDIARFTERFGPRRRVLDRHGVRFITVDSSRLRLRGPGFDEIGWLRDRLADAENAGQVGAVAVVSHVPTRDPMPANASRLIDPGETAAVERLLAGFARRTGKGVALLSGHVGAFAAWHRDGVGYYVNGNSGKSPAAAPGDGGFTGWTEFGADPPTPDEQAARRRNPYRCDGNGDWLTAATRPRVDRLRLDLPPVLTVGHTVTPRSEFDQDDRTIPVRPPVTARWTASSDAVTVDPGIGTVTARRPGEALVTVTVNRVTAGTHIVVRE